MSENISWIWPNFTPEELASGDGKPWPIISRPAREALDALQSLRTDLGFPFRITSAFRSEEHNAKIGGAENSMHLYGMAFDIACNGEQAFTIASVAASYGFRGIGVSQKGAPTSRFIHLDTRKGARAIWSY